MVSKVATGTTWERVRVSGEVGLLGMILLRVGPYRVGIGGIARDGQVVHEAFIVVYSLALRQRELMIRHCHFVGVETAGQSNDKLPQLFVIL